MGSHSGSAVGSATWKGNEAVFSDPENNGCKFSFKVGTNSPNLGNQATLESGPASLSTAEITASIFRASSSSSFFFFEECFAALTANQSRNGIKSEVKPRTVDMEWDGPLLQGTLAESALHLFKPPSKIAAPFVPCGPISGQDGEKLMAQSA